jgi:hypothetical protein
MAVIGKQASDANAETGVVGEGGMQESDGRSSGAVGEHLGKSNAGMVIDGDVEALPAGMMLAATATVGTCDNVGKAAQGLEVEMEQIARSWMLVANERNSRLQIAHAVEAQAAKNTANGGPAATGKAGNVQTGEALAAQMFHLLDLMERNTARRAMRTRGTVQETGSALLLVSADPLGGSMGADVEGGGRRLQRRSLQQDTLCQLLSTNEGKSCILMKVHSSSPV